MADNSPFVLLPMLGAYLEKSTLVILPLVAKVGSFIIQHEY